MLTLALETLLGVVRGELIHGLGTTMVNGVVIDSRHVEPGVAFIAFPGDRVDGHEYITDAISMGARAVLITRPVEEISVALEHARERDVAVVRVASALDALQDLAAYHRGRLFCPVIGVTGSTGKTTTKDFITSVLSVRSRVVATYGNQNNEIGVPLTLLRAGADTDVLVVEMAMRGAGQIARLCEIASPSAGIVTNVGTSHIELLGDQEAIASAKGELIEAVPASGVAFLNADDAYSGRLAERASARVVRYGLNSDADVTALDLIVDAEGRASFTLVADGESRAVTLSIPGRHNVYNALAAAAVGLYLDVGLDDVVEGLRTAEAGEMRMQAFESATGVFVINDAYNANPTSMRAAIETLADMQASGSRIAVLGDMAELGSLTELAHFHIGEEVARLPIDSLITVGPRARRIADGARAEGMDESSIHPFDSVDEARDHLAEAVSPGDVVLVKASRVMGLEGIVEGIVSPDV